MNGSTDRGKRVLREQIVELLTIKYLFLFHICCLLSHRIKNAPYIALPLITTRLDPLRDCEPRTSTP
jgi:hypothetical protein